MNFYGLADPYADPDTDTLNNLEEYQNQTNPYLDDTDGDTLKDGDELIMGLDPSIANDLELIRSDNNTDGFADNLGLYFGYYPLDLDVDGDGIVNATEIEQGSNPLEADTDADGVEDSLDVFPLDPTRSTQPASATPPVITLIQPEFAISL